MLSTETSPAGTPQQRLEIAEALFFAGAFAEAESAYRLALAEAPQHLSANIGASRCARRRGDRQASAACLAAALGAHPANLSLRIELAADLRELGQLDAAEEQGRQAVALAPRNVHAHLSLGHCARKRGDRTTAMAIFQSAAALAPSEPAPRIELAADLRELGQLDAAEEQCRQALALAPSNVHAHLGLAHCARKRGDRAAAMAIFRSAAAAAPSEPAPLIELAADLRELGQWGAAEEQCRQALALAPNNVYAHLGLAHCARKRGDRQAAMAIFRSAAAAAPSEPAPRIELAADLRELGQLEAAEEQCREALALAPDYVYAHLGLGHCARKRGDRRAAMAWFQSASRANPLDAAPLIEIAVEQREAGDPDAAIRTARDVLARDPDNLHALMSIGISERYACRHEAALAAFTLAHHASPANAAPLVEMAVEQRMLGRQAACDERLAKAFACDPRNVSVIGRRAEQAMLACDAVTVEAIYRQALEAQPRELAFHLGIAEALARQGKPDEALAMLAGLHDSHGPAPAISAKRISLLHQSGDYFGALHLVRQETALAPHGFDHWVQRFGLEILVGSNAEIESCLSHMRPGTLHQRATVVHLHGIFAEGQWRYADAIRCYEMAAGMNPGDNGIQHSLVRSKLLTFDLAGAQRHLRRFCDRTAYITRLQKKSPNMSQSLYGQLLEDFSLDHDLAGSLAATQTIPPWLRLPALRQAVLDNPDSTGAAIALMIALRQAGAFARVVEHPSDPDSLIPKRIMQFWDSEDLPPDVDHLMRGWGDRNPDHTRHVFCDRTARAYLRRQHPDSVLAAYRRAQEAAQKSDIFRLAWLAAEGGVYADADDRSLRPLATIIPANADLVMYQEDVASIGNNFIAARAGHPVIVLALSRAVEAINRGDTDNVWLSTGPALLTRALATHLATGDAEQLAVPKGIHVLDRRDLNRVVAMNCMLGYKNSQRNWANSVFAKRRRAA
jgi:tetratricopeptide (TPR) repeat protein/mannosyltransferase OCH1-like enzyme